MNIVIEFYKDENRIQFFTDKSKLTEKESTIVSEFIESVQIQKDNFFRDFELIIDVQESSIKFREQDKLRSFNVPGYDLSNLLLSFASFNKDFPFWIEDVDDDIKGLEDEFDFVEDDEE